MLDDLWQRVDRAGRDPAEIDVSFVNPLGSDPGTPDFDPDRTLEGLSRLTALGVTWTSTGAPSDSVDRAVEALELYGEQVISKA